MSQKKETPAAKGPTKKPGKNRKQFTRGFVQDGFNVEFFKWGTKKIVLKSPVVKG